MDTSTIIQVIGGSALTFLLGGVSFLARSYFQRIQEDIAEMRTTLRDEGRAGGKVEGSLEALGRTVQAQTEATTQLRAEVNALWRFLEGSHERMTDKTASRRG
jgi:hypothetical protein